MVKIRKPDVQQINTALNEIQKALEEIIKRIEKLEAQQTTNNT
jgi:uncharacterized protein YutE (UPF0331/DUF86 family)